MGRSLEGPLFSSIFTARKVPSDLSSYLLRHVCDGFFFSLYIFHARITLSSLFPHCSLKRTVVDQFVDVDVYMWVFACACEWVGGKTAQVLI